jgi:hypothetical protein
MKFKIPAFQNFQKQPLLYGYLKKKIFWRESPAFGRGDGFKIDFWTNISQGHAQTAGNPTKIFFPQIAIDRRLFWKILEGGNFELHVTLWENRTFSKNHYSKMAPNFKKPKNRYRLKNVKVFLEKQFSAKIQVETPLPGLSKFDPV